MITRKLLKPINFKNPTKNINDFLYLELTEQNVSLISIKNGEKWDYGMVVLVGEFSENELLAKIIEANNHVESNNKTTVLLKKYLQEINKFKIGNILYVEKANNDGFILKKYANRITLTKRPKIP